MDASSSNTVSTSPTQVTTNIDQLDPASILERLRDQQDIIKAAEVVVAKLKEQLFNLYEDGAIPKTFQHHGITATLAERKGSWEYSPAVNALKKQEELDGIAKVKPSSFFWTIKSTPQKAAK
jgi:hypothetical protein